MGALGSVQAWKRKTVSASKTLPCPVSSMPGLNAPPLGGCEISCEICLLKALGFCPKDPWFVAGLGGKERAGPPILRHFEPNEQRGICSQRRNGNVERSRALEDRRSG